MKKLEIKVEENNQGEITIKASNDGFTPPELIGLLELKKMDIVEQCRNPQNFIHRRRYKDKDGEWVEIEEGGAE